MLYDLKNSDTLERIVQIVESQENQDRIKKHLEAYQIINGDQYEHILTKLTEKYPESYSTMSIVNLKIGQKIIRKLARCYNTGVQREIVDKNGKKNEELTKLINYIYDDITDSSMNFDDMMIENNKLEINHKYLEIFTYIGEDNRIKFKGLPPHIFTAIPNEDKTKAEIIVFTLELTEFHQYYKFIDDINKAQESDWQPIKAYTVWTKDDNFTFVRLKSEKMDEGKATITFQNAIIAKESNKDGKNPYQIMPFVPVKKPTNGHFYPYISEISGMSRDLNIMLSDLVSIANYQGFGQAVQYYNSETPPQVIKTGVTQIVNIKNADGKSKFEFVNPSPDLKGHMDIILSLIRLLLTTNDLTTDKVSGELSATNFTSGVDRLVADSETVTNVEDQRKKYISAEKNQFKVMMQILKYLSATKQMPKDYPTEGLTDASYDANLHMLKISFNDIKPLTTEKGKAESITYLEEKGYIKAHEKHMRFNESLSEDEAKKREAEIKEEKKQKATEALNNHMNNYQENRFFDAKQIKKDEKEFVDNDPKQEKKPLKLNNLIKKKEKDDKTK